LKSATATSPITILSFRGIILSGQKYDRQRPEMFTIFLPGESVKSDLPPPI
jgi:hypothetical protein